MVVEFNDIRQPSEGYNIKIMRVQLIGRRQYSLPEANEGCITLYYTMACTQVRTQCSNMAMVIMHVSLPSHSSVNLHGF